jgi:hypothetical protein
MIAAMYCTSGFAPRETECNQTPRTLLDQTLKITDEHLRTMHLNQLCALWTEFVGSTLTRLPK